MNVSDARRRQDVLADLVKLRLTPEAAVAAVRKLSWDSEVELVLLQRADVIILLQRYLRAEVSSGDLETWANAVEGRDDIGLEPGYEELLREFVFETANPILAGPISESYAYRWLARLGVRG